MFSSNTSQVVATSTQAEAVDFDGTNDYLSRSTDLTGNTDNKTFTFSAWVWSSSTSTSATTIYSAYDPSSVFTRFEIGLNGNQVRVLGYNTSNSLVLQASGTLLGISKANTFYHVLFSMDMANTSNRYIYVNDVSVLDSVAAYENLNIGFATSTHYVGALAGTPTLGARFSNVYFDKTYRDLSVTANRRLFITADLKPAAGQAALNPILYLPMSNPTTVGTNAGTGGNFTLTGTIARSGRGPNQYNAPYSDLDGSADYLSKAAVTGLSDSQVFTMNFAFNNDAIGTTQYIFLGRLSPYTKFLVSVDSGLLTVTALNSSVAVVLSFSSRLPYASTLTTNRNYVVSISIDLSSTSNRHVYINGESATTTWTTYTVGGTINFTGLNVFAVGSNYAGGGTFFNGRLGALWFNTSYIDLSVASNLAKFVSGTGIDAKPVDLGATGELPTGTAPLIYLPMYANRAGKNYGTGGDFTVNSGPYTGARGPNEFWGNKASGFNGSSNIYLTKATALSGVPSSGSTLSIVCWFNLTNYTSNRTIFGTNSAGTMTLQVTSGGNLFMWLDSSGYVQFSQVVPTGSWVCLMFSKTGSTYTVYVNDTVHTVDVANSFNRGNSVTYTNTPVNIATRYDGSSTGEKWYGSLSEFYFTTEYIDFSQEANRLKFRDCFGNPTDLPSAITAASVPNPAIYMRFSPTSFGTNSGTGGNFTVTGTITDGGQL